MELMVENLSVKSFQTKYENFQDFIFNMAARSDMRSKLLSHSFPFLLSRGYWHFPYHPYSGIPSRVPTGYSDRSEFQHVLTLVNVLFFYCSLPYLDPRADFRHVQNGNITSGWNSTENRIDCLSSELNRSRQFQNRLVPLRKLLFCLAVNIDH